MPDEPVKRACGAIDVRTGSAQTVTIARISYKDAGGALVQQRAMKLDGLSDRRAPVQRAGKDNRRHRRSFPRKGRAPPKIAGRVTARRSSNENLLQNRHVRSPVLAEPVADRRDADRRSDLRAALRQ